MVEFGERNLNKSAQFAA